MSAGASLASNHDKRYLDRSPAGIWLGWEPDHPGLIADLDDGHRFA
jgi:hypothetical protein